MFAVPISGFEKKCGLTFSQCKHFVGILVSFKIAFMEIDLIKKAYLYNLEFQFCTFNAMNIKADLETQIKMYSVITLNK